MDYFSVKFTCEKILQNDNLCVKYDLKINVLIFLNREIFSICQTNDWYFVKQISGIQFTYELNIRSKSPFGGIRNV